MSAQRIAVSALALLALASCAPPSSALVPRGDVTIEIGGIVSAGSGSPPACDNSGGGSCICEETEFDGDGNYNGDGNARPIPGPGTDPDNGEFYLLGTYYVCLG